MRSQHIVAARTEGNALVRAVETALHLSTSLGIEKQLNFQPVDKPFFPKHAPLVMSDGHKRAREGLLVGTGSKAICMTNSMASHTESCLVTVYSLCMGQLTKL